LKKIKNTIEKKYVESEMNDSYRFSRVKKVRIPLESDFNTSDSSKKESSDEENNEMKNIGICNLHDQNNHLYNQKKNAISGIIIFGEIYIFDHKKGKWFLKK
jgi:hypothetical protein